MHFVYVLIDNSWDEARVEKIMTDPDKALTLADAVNFDVEVHALDDYRFTIDDVRWWYEKSFQDKLKHQNPPLKFMVDRLQPDGTSNLRVEPNGTDGFLCRYGDEKVSWGASTYGPLR